MTEPEKTKIQVRKPDRYLEIPIETPANGSGTGKEGSPFYAKDEIPNFKTTFPSLDSARENVAGKDPSGDLIAAVQTVFRVVTARIAHHEKEAQRLREALAPFAGLARQSAAPPSPSDNGTVEALLRAVEKLSEENSNAGST